MTDQTEPMPEPQWEEPPPVDVQWDQPNPLEGKPQQLDSDHGVNHVYTLSYSPSGRPMLVVRANSATELTLRLAEARSAGVYVQLAEAQQAWANSAPVAETIMRELGATQVATFPQQAPPAQPYQQAAPAPWDMPGVAGPPVPSPGQPPFGAPPGGYVAPQPQWGGAAPAASRPAGWFAVKIPFQQKDAGDQVKNMLKQTNQYSGNVKWEGATKTWLVSPAVVQYFAQWNPVPA